MATKKFRNILHSILVCLCLVLFGLLIWFPYLFLFNKIHLGFLIVIILLWFFIGYVFLDLFKVIIFLFKTPVKNGQFKKNGEHEEILDNYLNSNEFSKSLSDVD